jgi:hypothetical protein
MGLAEKRYLKTLQTETIPPKLTELNAAVGFPIAFEIDWTSLQDDMKAMEYFATYCIDRIADAIKGICIDDIGKEAAKEKIRTVKVANVKNDGDKAMALDGGIFDVKMSLHESNDGYFSADEMKTFLEGKL